MEHLGTEDEYIEYDGTLDKKQADWFKTMMEAVAWNEDFDTDALQKQMPQELWDVSKKRAIFWRNMMDEAIKKNYEKQLLWAEILNKNRAEIVAQPWYKK